MVDFDIETDHDGAGCENGPTYANGYGGPENNGYGYGMAPGQGYPGNFGYGYGKGYREGSGSRTGKGYG